MQAIAAVKEASARDTCEVCGNWLNEESMVVDMAKVKREGGGSQ